MLLKNYDRNSKISKYNFMSSVIKKACIRGTGLLIGIT